MSITPIYTVKRIDEIQPYGPEVKFFYENVVTLSKMFGIDYLAFDFYRYAREHIVWIARKKGDPVGWLLARLYPHVWDSRLKVLRNDSLFVKSPNQKATHLLLKAFIDFGRKNADLVFTSSNKYTNVKESSFVRLGFKKTEELYALEINE